MDDETFQRLKTAVIVAVYPSVTLGTVALLEIVKRAVNSVIVDSEHSENIANAFCFGIGLALARNAADVSVRRCLESNFNSHFNRMSEMMSPSAMLSEQQIDQISAEVSNFVSPAVESTVLFNFLKIVFPDISSGELSGPSTQAPIGQYRGVVDVPPK